MFLARENGRRRGPLKPGRVAANNKVRGEPERAPGCPYSKNTSGTPLTTNERKQDEPRGAERAPDAVDGAEQRAVPGVRPHRTAPAGGRVHVPVRLLRQPVVP